jgi:Bacterial Ig domain/Secretion system C-terminal sorting domain
VTLVASFELLHKHTTNFYSYLFKFSSQMISCFYKNYLLLLVYLSVVVPCFSQQLDTAAITVPAPMHYMYADAEGKVSCTDNEHVMLEAIRTMPLNVQPHNSFTRIVQPANSVSLRSGASATFDVSYLDFSDEAKAAFQYAVDIWANSISSSQIIRVKATMLSMKNPNGSLNTITIGSAGSNSLIRPSGASAFYQMALADALNDKDYNSGAPDIIAQFNTNFSFYYGTDGQTPAGKTDFVSVVLHELGHGLGFSGSARVSSSTPPCRGIAGEGCLGYVSNNIIYPMYFDTFVETKYKFGGKITDDFNTPNPSTDLGNALTSESLYWTGSNAIAANGSAPKLYSPKTWQQGSSYSHFDEKYYPSGNVNSLMSPGISRAESIHTLGPVGCAVMQDLGWKISGPICEGNGNTPPIVDMVFPNNNATFTAPANVPLSATATDKDGSISKVEFYNGTTLLGTSTTAPYTYNWTNVSAGTYTITAKAYDNLNAVTASSVVMITVRGGGTNTPPIVDMVFPSNNANFTAPANVLLAVYATDSDGTISKVEFYNGTTLLGTSTTSPYAYVWTNVSAGTYTLTAKAYDNLGAVTTSTAATIIVKASTPTPVSGQVICNISGNIMIFSNYDGGALNINVDENIPNLKIGIVSYEPVAVQLSGAYVGNVTSIVYAGYNDTNNNNHCSDVLTTSIEGAPDDVTPIILTTPATTISNSASTYMVCGYECSTVARQGSCNTIDQIASFFLDKFSGGSIYAMKLQYGCWLGNQNVSEGGTCCLSTLADIAATSKVNNLSMNKEMTMNVSPNPAQKGMVNLSVVANIEGKYEVTILDMTGRKLVQQQMNLVAGENIQAINTNILDSGLYLVKLSRADKFIVQKLIIH